MDEGRLLEWAPMEFRRRTQHTSGLEILARQNNNTNAIKEQEMVLIKNEIENVSSANMQIPLRAS